MRIKTTIATLLTLLISLSIATSCCDKCDKSVGKRIDALNCSAWESSKWISVVDAQVVPDTLKTYRSADGASWFVSTLKNEKRVVSAKWMTAGLGVYELYIILVIFIHLFRVPFRQ